MMMRLIQGIEQVRIGGEKPVHLTEDIEVYACLHGVRYKCKKIDSSQGLVELPPELREKAPPSGGYAMTVHFETQDGDVFMQCAPYAGLPDPPPNRRVGEQEFRNMVVRRIQNPSVRAQMTQAEKNVADAFVARGGDPITQEELLRLGVLDGEKVEWKNKPKHASKKRALRKVINHLQNEHHIFIATSPLGHWIPTRSQAEEYLTDSVKMARASFLSAYRTFKSLQKILGDELVQPSLFTDILDDLEGGE